ncbi:hypothetical protein [Cupriavidus sp. RAF12]|uniref:hypothetical protein n=1 Tax=Cupriavidus sp. RAF12 TaxID=3233050 RepID=UPI003F91D8D0
MTRNLHELAVQRLNDAGTWRRRAMTARTKSWRTRYKHMAELDIAMARTYRIHQAWSLLP